MTLWNSIVVTADGEGPGRCARVRVIAAGQLLARARRERGERERGERAVVDVGLDGEEDVVAAGVVPLVWRAAHGADPSGHHPVGVLA